jgi:O-antigen/teichoic acid export membrane protein
MSLRIQTAHALRWGILARFGAQLITWTSTFIIIRLLEPGDYGLMALAMTVITFSTRLNDAGLTASIIQSRALSPDELSSLFSVTLLINIVIFIIILCSAPAVSYIYESDITWLLRFLAFVVILQIVGRIQETILVRNFDFKSKAKVDTIAQVIGSAVSLILAFLHFGVWALASAAVATAAARAIGFTFLSRVRVRYSSAWRLALPHLRFGGLVFADRLASWLYTQIDVVILGALHPPFVVGAYSVGRYLGNLPNSKIGNVLNLVSFSAYARTQGDQASFRSILKKAISFLSVISFPTFFGMAALAGDLVVVVLSEKWIAAVVPLILISMVIPLRMLNTQLVNALQGIGKPTDQLKNSVIYLVFIIPAVLTGALLGAANEVAAGWAIGYGLAWIIVVWRSSAKLGLAVWNLLEPAALPAVSATIMVVVIEIVRAMTAVGDLAPLHRLVVLVPLGATVYGILMLAFDSERIRDLLAYVLGRPRPSAAAA